MRAVMIDLAPFNVIRWHSGCTSDAVYWRCSLQDADLLFDHEERLIDCAGVAVLTQASVMYLTEDEQRGLYMKLRARKIAHFFFCEISSNEWQESGSKETRGKGTCCRLPELFPDDFIVGEGDIALEHPRACLMASKIST